MKKLNKYQKQIKYNLDKLDKNNKNEVIEFIKESLPIIAFDFETRLGFPVEIFKEEFNSRKLNNAEILRFILNYIS